ncbi:MAG: hypothetical protein ACI4LH_02565 [Candidatus Heritagella sp.]
MALPPFSLKDPPYGKAARKDIETPCRSFLQEKRGKVFLYSLFLVEMKGAVQVELQKGQQPLVAKENGTIGGGNRIPLLK